MKKKILQSVAGIILVVLVAFSCQKSDQSEEDEIKHQVSNEAYVEQVFDEVHELADQAYIFRTQELKGGELEQPDFAPCATVTLDTTVMPRVLTIDFGPVNCLCNDGKWRRGSIIVTFNGRWRRPGTVITHTFQQYYVNDNHVQGTKVIENQGLVNGHMTFVHTNNGSVTFAQGGEVVSWQSQRVHSWIEGFATPRWRDDVYLITGYSNFEQSNGRTVSREIVQPLRRALICRYIESGTVRITPSDGPQRLLDFGDGTCDNQATITIGERVITITLP